MPKRYWLVEYRAKKNLSQQKCAKLCGMSPSNYCLIENGRVSPMISTAYKISQTLEFDFNEWMRG